MDIVFLHGIKVECVIGVWEWERRVKQLLTIDLDMAVDVARAAQTDRLEDTLDYKMVGKKVMAFVAESEFQLVETLAEKIAHILLNEFAIPWCRVRLNKGGAVRGARHVGIEIERGQKPAG